MRCRVKVKDIDNDDHFIEYLFVDSVDEAFIVAQNNWPAPQYKIEYIAKEKEAE